VTDEDFWYASFFIALLRGDTVEESKRIADEAQEIDREFT